MRSRGWMLKYVMHEINDRVIGLYSVDSEARVSNGLTLGKAVWASVYEGRAR